MSLDVKSIEQVVAPFVDGALTTSKSDTRIDVINPSDGKICLTIPAGCDKDVAAAVDSARRAFDDGRWSEAPPSQRKRALHRLADLIAAKSAVLDALDAGEMGKPVREPCANASAAAGVTKFYAEAVDKLCGDTYTSDKTTFVAQRRVPRGVVAAVTPWNFPTVNAMSKVAPALAAGNCVVLKPSELSSRSAVYLAGLATEAGVPPGVLNVVPGRGEIVGRALGMHMNVDMLTFTGSTDIGKQMMCYAGQSNMKVIMTECGGKSPQLVFDDGVDLDAAARSVAQMILTNQGQVCSAGTRLLVERSIEVALLEKLLSHLTNISIGNALDPATTFGPLVSSQQCARVMQYIQIAKDEGAEVVTGGRRVLPETGGYFVEPTVFRNVSVISRIAQEEIFGPVLSVITFENEAEAIEIANGTIYGLASYVWTADLARALRVTRRIRSSVWVNAAAPSGEGAGHAASYEPALQSGIGTEGGLAGMESYLRRQLVWINHS